MLITDIAQLRVPTQLSLLLTSRSNPGFIWIVRRSNHATIQLALGCELVLLAVEAEITR